eukprot:3420185-Alexandrium_andersonii.AAC.1
MALGALAWAGCLGRLGRRAALVTLCQLEGPGAARSGLTRRNFAGPGPLGPGVTLGALAWAGCLGRLGRLAALAMRCQPPC